jgi:hypothetical protein
MLRVTAIWIMAVIIGLLFVLVGWSKLAGPSGTDWAVRLSRWGYPAASRYGIGGTEILAGLGLCNMDNVRSAQRFLVPRFFSPSESPCLSSQTQASKRSTSLAATLVRNNL